MRGLDVVLEPGERVLLLGPSGAGKSTLLAGLAGLLDPAESGGDEEGALLLDGVPAARARLAGVRAGRARTGLLLQDPQAQTVLARCGDDVAFGLENHAVPTAEIWPRVDQALAAVGFPYGRDHPTAALSGGERQRLALAGVLALRPGLLLLDEPTAMLDPDGAQQVRGSVAAVLAATGAGCLLVEHRVEPWLELIDRVVVLDPGGGVRADGPPQRVFAERGAELAAAGVWVPGHTGGSGNIGSVMGTGCSTITGGSGWAGGAGGVLLEARGLGARRPGQVEPAVRNIDLSVRAGRATCVTGPNGVGKSTLALTLAGLVRPAEGTLTAPPELARGAGPQPYRWRAGQLVSRIGTVFQEPQHQFVAATVAAELAVGPARLRGAQPSRLSSAWPSRRRPDQPSRLSDAPQPSPLSDGPQPSRLSGDRRPDPHQVSARTTELLERLRLNHLAQANPFTLSGGEQRRLSVATVLATSPSVLVLDEPTFGQDARTWAELTLLLTELLTEGSALVVATHDAELVAELGRPGRGEVLAL